MRKIILALSVVFVLASFTNNTNNTIVLKDIDGTLFQSYPVINQDMNGEFTITFTVDANTIVTSNVDENGTHIHLIDNGVSNLTATHSFSINAGSLDFENHFEGNIDVASLNSGNTMSVMSKKKPPSIIVGDI